MKKHGAFQATGDELKNEDIGFKDRMTILIHNTCPEKKHYKLKRRKKTYPK